ncbi:thioesterase family protein [Xenorhabdus bovienii]|uniref:Medium/long-chain acyl-CoA thioesterase YigI n=1 Tax=Xenorhabdus bovienii str. Intermedium TaxID=1379677 RepID=A0A077QDG6_XENBV|nr:thioesterase family protein [Xenorhabdus bovienii]MCG3460859.1 thioesterase family protein [Xenorhabdus bovienii]MDE1473214.1 thioesterase family protein [Xenorhabdus bovienii]MDE9428241.1 thioesterase family protein [Xenorhabdus bovienii]MDE9432314.1 thioesterase family protein [Xenorhabdus bovienii]MDE9453077.1 thioesterase family protein [Xenorhabdus bovienii]
METIQRSTQPLTQEEARKIIGDLFVYHMPFNQLLGFELLRFDHDYAELQFRNQDKLVGNMAQKILHGGVIASILDVAGGLICAGNALTAMETITMAEMEKRLPTIGTIDLRIDYLRPGRGEVFTASSNIVRSGNKVSVARIELHNERQVHIASAMATYLVG